MSGPLVDVEELNSFDALAIYAPQNQGAEHAAPHADEPDSKFQRRDKGAAGKGRGAPPSIKRGRERESFDNFSDPRASDSSFLDRWQSWSYQPRYESKHSELEYLRQQVSMLQRMALRHEDALCLMRQEVAFIVHFRIGVEASLVPAIYRAQAGWREIYRTAPSKLGAPMRNTLLECVLKELRSRLTTLAHETAKAWRETMIKAGWLIADSSASPDEWQWAFLSWDAAKRVQIVNASRTALAHNKILASIDILLAGISKPDSLSRFQPLRRVTEQMSGASVGFALQYPFKGVLAQELYTATLDICNSAAAQLVAAQFRVDRGQRSGLANAIAKSHR